MEMGAGTPTRLKLSEQQTSRDTRVHLSLIASRAAQPRVLAQLLSDALPPPPPDEPQFGPSSRRTPPQKKLSLLCCSGRGFPGEHKLFKEGGFPQQLIV